MRECHGVRNIQDRQTEPRLTTGNTPGHWNPISTRRGYDETGRTSSEWEIKKSLAERAVRALSLCVRSVFDRKNESRRASRARFTAVRTIGV